MTTSFFLRSAAFGLVALTATFVMGQQNLGYTNTPMLPDSSWHVHDGARPQPRIVTPGATFSQQATAPSDATVLFDGKDLSKWESNTGGEAKWRVEAGYYMEAVRGSGGIRTRDKFADFQLHLEFATPPVTPGSGQDRGNS